MQLTTLPTMIILLSAASATTIESTTIVKDTVRNNECVEHAGKLRMGKRQLVVRSNVDDSSASNVFLVKPSFFEIAGDTNVTKMVADLKMSSALYDWDMLMPKDMSMSMSLDMSMDTLFSLSMSLDNQMLNELNRWESKRVVDSLYKPMAGKGTVAASEHAHRSKLVSVRAMIKNSNSEELNSISTSDAKASSQSRLTSGAGALTGRVIIVFIVLAVALLIVVGLRHYMQSQKATQKKKIVKKASKSK